MHTIIIYLLKQCFFYHALKTPTKGICFSKGPETCKMCASEAVLAVYHVPVLINLLSVLGCHLPMFSSVLLVIQKNSNVLGKHSVFKL